MAEIFLQKAYGVLTPADEAAEEIIAKMHRGQVIKATYSFPRNYENHKRFFAFLKTTFDMQEHFTNIEHYRKWLIMKAGYYQTIKAPNGYTIFDTESIAFHKMDEAKFRELFEDCITAFLSAFGDKITREELEDAISFSS